MALSYPYFTIVLLLRGFFLFAGTVKCFRVTLCISCCSIVTSHSSRGTCFSSFSFLRVCVCVYLGLCVHTCFCVLRPEVNVGYVSHYFQPYFVRLSLTESRAQWLRRLIRGRHAGTACCCPILSTGVTNAHHHAQLILWSS